MGCGGSGAEAWERESDVCWRRSVTQWQGPDAATQCQGVVADREAAEGMIQEQSVRGIEALWGALRRYMECCYPVVCTVDAASVEHGLSDQRCYSLLGAREVPAGGKMLRMVMLRAPSGKGVWTGRWSLDSDAWDENPVARDLLQFRHHSFSGAFWMSYSDFLFYFRGVSVVRKSMPVQGCNETNKLVGLKRGLGLTWT